MQKIKLLQTVKTTNERGEPIVYAFGSLFPFSCDVMIWIKANKLNYMAFSDNSNDMRLKNDSRRKI